MITFEEFKQVLLGKLCKTIMLALFCVMSTSLYAQKIAVSGTVKDANGEPLIGASIKEKSTFNGTVTDLDGAFSLSVASDATLQITYTGFSMYEESVAGKTVFNVVLQEDTKALEEVVVVGYGSMKRTDVATAIATVKPEDFNLGGGQDVRSLLEGQVAGLSITRVGGGSPNRTATVQLRGVSSLEGSNSPLFIIDGIPGGSLELVRPEDIASIEVLKDGSAAAIYGSRASGGVIIVTTKQGAAGKTNVEYSAYVSHYAQGRKLDFLNAKEYLAMKDKIENPSAIVDWGGDTDWYGAVLNENNVSHSHNLSLSGGAGSTTYRASLFYSNSESIAIEDARRDYGGRASLITKGLNEMLTFQTNFAVTFSNLDRLNSDNRVWETALKYNPTIPIKNEDGTYWEHNSYSENIVARNEQQYMKRDQQYTSLDAKLTLEPIKDLRIAITGGVVTNEYTSGSYYTKANRVSVNSYNGGGYASRGENKSFVTFAEPTASYLKTFADVHKIDAVVGYSYRYAKDESFSAWNTGFISDAVHENDLGSGSGLNKGSDYMGMSSSKEEEKLIAFFGRLNYVFDNRYIAQVSLRREGSTKFGVNHRWGNFPSISLAWNVTNEEFMKAVPTISNMKLRVGYGETGQTPNARYEHLVTVGSGGYYLRPDGVWTQTYGPSKNPNPDLKWETKKEWNLGLDLGVLNNRVTGAIDLYKRVSSDLIIGGVAVPSPSNVHSSSTLNIGETDNTGVEVTLQAIPVSTADLRWKAFLTYSHLFSNKLTKYKGGTSYKTVGGIGGYGALGDAFRIYEGGEIGQFYGKKFAGFDEKGDWLFYKKDGSKVGAGQITEEDLGYIGNGVPKHHLSLTNMIDYKNFDFTLGLKSRLGFEILNRMNMTYGNLKTLESGDNVFKNVLTEGVNASYQYSDYYLENGNYLKIDNITVGYTFRHKNPTVPSFRLYATVRDLLTITNYKGYDPEMQAEGMEPSMEDRNRIPVTRTFLFGLNVKF